MYAKLTDEKHELFQWDTGQYMEVSSDVDRIDFHFRTTRGIVYGVFSEEGKVVIPDILLQSSGILDCLVMVDNDGVYTMERMEIPVIERPMPPGYVMTKRGMVVSYDDLESVLGKFDLLRTTGGKMTGDIDMDGHMVSNLDDAEGDGDAVSKHYAGNHFLSLDGGAMRGRVTGLQEPVQDTEPATKRYADTKLEKSGGVMTGRITGLQDPEENTEAANKNYVDKGIIKVVNATVPVASWTEDATYDGYNFRASVSVPNAKSSMFPIVVLAPAEAESGNYCPVSMAGDGDVKIYAVNKPVEQLTIPSIVIWR